MPPNIKIDQNSRSGGAGYNPSVTRPQSLKVDPVTGALLVEITVTTNTTPVLNRPRIDENARGTANAVDTNGVIRPLLIDNRTGYLWVDIA